MDNSYYALTEDQLRSYQEKGFLLVRGFFNTRETQLIQQWTQEVHDFPRTPDATYMPYEEVNSEGKRVLCRTENYANSHAGFDSFLRGERILSVLQQLATEDMLLFKEKINYKLAGSGGFSPHIDANAYTHVKNIKHLTVLAAVDEMTSENGGLDVVDGSHLMEVPLGEDRCIEPAWVKSQTWTPCDLQPGSPSNSSNKWSRTNQNYSGDILIFSSYLAHKSGANTSSKDRRAIYATYNRKAEGDLHDQYYEDRRKLWPATHMRKDGETYEEGKMRYGYGSPMLTVEGEQPVLA
ncbi:phytanoyl-CoA dioxygenase family protein [Aspergillus ibericus CBS 121593]|uniref:PhyH-domain-containing protein n=1 Tax=Aspergillus ibericus CBS 121593 TaxID=1448316 RepID=A0A395H277_9EURO|nr:PhyH-domain-containing protein [Aspergillus ibericus CBS 121593]RAL01773.1 PhyH-domain-containing protein [Aspergillus ibericus CBS 121593]